MRLLVHSAPIERKHPASMNGSHSRISKSDIEAPLFARQRISKQIKKQPFSYLIELHLQPVLRIHHSSQTVKAETETDMGRNEKD